MMHETEILKLFKSGIAAQLNGHGLSCSGTPEQAVVWAGYHYAEQQGRGAVKIAEMLFTLDGLNRDETWGPDHLDFDDTVEMIERVLLS